MKKLSEILEHWLAPDDERGSALLVTLMVMVGLSLLGLGFVAVSETESAISVNQRNYTQTQAVSEAAAKIVVEWFQNPEWATSKGFMPRKSHADYAAMKPNRLVNNDLDKTTFPDAGKYKDHTDYPLFCCDKPFKPAQLDRLYGTEDHPDMLVNASTSSSFLQSFNTLLFPKNGPNDPLVTDIRVYAPPILNGTQNNAGYIEGGTRYGLATILVTAEKKDDAGNSIALRRTKIVISEWPFPGPQGPVQSNANISTGGNVVVHWGKMTSQGTTFVKRELVGLPWLHASHNLTLEDGYDSSRAWAANKAYGVGDVVYPADPTLAELYAFRVETAGTSGPGPEPTWSTAYPPDLAQPTTSDNGITWRAITAKQYKIDPTAYLKWGNYLASVSGLMIDDPWVEVRARGAITNTAVASLPAPPKPQPFRYQPYVLATQDVLNNAGTAGLANWFQLQDVTDEAANKKEVTFPRIDYRFWKQTALSAKGQEGVYYLKWVSADIFTDGRSTKTFKEWTNTARGAKPGFYFFDTKNSQNPQVPGGSAYLTPPFKVSNAGGNIFQMAGFIYLNTEDFGTTGVTGLDGRYGFPGEPYRDIGYWKALEAGVGTATKLELNPLGTAYVVDNEKVGNGRWDYQDVNKNGKFDLYLESKTVTRPNGTLYTGWFPRPFFNGCIPADNSVGVGLQYCSEPHEPYLNLVYPSRSCCESGSYPKKLEVKWEDPYETTTPITRRPKKKHEDGTIPPTTGADIGICTTAADFNEFCTSNGYDRDGALDEWTGSGQNNAPLLNGVLYNEGKFSDTSGNGRYFGSVLINGDIDPLGTAEVWFDERLIKEEWPPKEWPFPRAFITAISTDQ